MPEPGIGVVGTGFIVDPIQLTAYRDAGYEVRAIAARTTERAATVAGKWGVESAYGDWHDLLADPAVEVLDIAYPPHIQPAIIEAALEQPRIRAILAQKPLTLDFTEAERLVTLCERAGTPLIVNQNMRFDSTMRRLGSLLGTGDLGTPVLMTMLMRTVPSWQPFIPDYDRLTLLNLSIHHLDICRYLFGDPDAIYVSARRDPRVEFEHRDGIVNWILEYGSGLRVTGIDDTFTGPDDLTRPAGDPSIEWRLNGTGGVAEGEIGWPYYPQHRPGTLRYSSLREPERVIDWRSDQAWFPDAFAGPMGQALAAAEGCEHELSGRDNLGTMRLVEAGYRSIEEHRAVRLEEIK